MDGSFIIIDSHNSGYSSSNSVICLDTDNEFTCLPRDPAKNLCRELREGCRGSVTNDSVIIIPDSSEDEEVEKSILKATGCEEVIRIPASVSDERKKSCRGQKRKREKSKDLQADEEQDVVSGCAERGSGKRSTDAKKEVREKRSDRGSGKRQSRRRSERLASVSTPLEPKRKMIKIHNDKPFCSTPILESAGTSTATPITLKYERMRSELSATKKQQEKLLSVQEELQKELQNFRKEFADKKKDDCKMISVKSDDDSLLRPIVVDGSNVAMSHGNHKVFSCRGIALCVQYFQERGHKNISVLVPLHRKTAEARRACHITDAFILDDLESKGLLSFTPSRQLKGRRVTPYDDRFILELACRNGGVIISNDNYRDLMVESAEFRSVVENRLIMFVFARDNFMVPEDPHGRHGPRLGEILRKDSAWSQMMSQGLSKSVVPTARLRIANGPVAQVRRSPRIAKILHMTGIRGSEQSRREAPRPNNYSPPLTNRRAGSKYVPPQRGSDWGTSTLQANSNGILDLISTFFQPRDAGSSQNASGGNICGAPSTVCRPTPTPTPTRRSPRLARIINNMGITGSTPSEMVPTRWDLAARAMNYNRLINDPHHTGAIPPPRVTGIQRYTGIRF